MDNTRLIGGALLVWWLTTRGEKKAEDKEPLPELPPSSVTVETLAWGKYFPKDLAQGIIDTALRLGFDPNCLASIVVLERGLTGGKLDDGVYHQYTRDGKTFTGDFSYGLIGILPGTAFWLGTTPEALYRMSDVEQLVWVEKYFTKHGWNKGGAKDVTGDPGGTLTSCDQIYMGVFYGDTGIKAGLYDTLLDKDKTPDLYETHKKMGLDKNDDGKITKKEVLSVFRKFVREGAKKTKG